MRAIFKIPDGAIGWNTFDNSSRKEANNIFSYPEELNDVHEHLTVIPAFTKKFGDYKFLWNGQVYYIFKEFLDPVIEELFDSDFEINF